MRVQDGLDIAEVEEIATPSCTEMDGSYICLDFVVPPAQEGNAVVIELCITIELMFCKFFSVVQTSAFNTRVTVAILTVFLLVSVASTAFLISRVLILRRLTAPRKRTNIYKFDRVKEMEEAFLRVKPITASREIILPDPFNC
jgi:hypothetical protein